MQQIVNAVPTAGEGDRVRGMVSALVTAGIDAGFLVNSRLAKVHWPAAGRPCPRLQAPSQAGHGRLLPPPAKRGMRSDFRRTKSVHALLSQANGRGA
jgi:hypothetical protein